MSTMLREQVSDDVSSGEIACRVVTSSQELASYQDDWTSLYLRMKHVSNFQSFAWNLAHADYHECEGRRIEVLFYYRGTRVVGIVPFCRHSRFGVSVLRWLSDPFGQYGDVLFDDDVDEALLTRMRDDICALRCDGFYLRKTKQSACFRKLPLPYRFRENNHERSPFLVSDLYENKDHYIESRSKRFRKTLRKLLRDYEKIDHAYKIGSATHNTIDEMIALKERQLKDKGVFAIGFGGDGLTSVLKRVSELEPHSVLCKSLAIEGQTIALEAMLKNHNRFEGYMCGYDLAYERYSPGHMQTYLTIMACLDTPGTQIDFLAPYDRYKSEFMDNTCDLSDIMIVRSPLGFVFYLSVFKARPLVKAFVLKLVKLKKQLNPLS